MFDSDYKLTADDLAMDEQTVADEVVILVGPNFKTILDELDAALAAAAAELMDYQTVPASSHTVTYPELTARADVEALGESTEAEFTAPTDLTEALKRGVKATQRRRLSKLIKPKPEQKESKTADLAAAMFGTYGPLVLLTMKRPEANKHSIVTDEGKEELQKGSRTGWWTWTGTHARKIRKYRMFCACVQRGEIGDTHDHSIAPLAHLSQRHREALAAQYDLALEEGIMLTGSPEVHARIVESEEAARRAANYIARRNAQQWPGDADEREDLKQRLQDELLEFGASKTKLIWRWPKRGSPLIR